MRPLQNTSKVAVVIGGGPAGLMAAETLIQGGVSVDLYEAKPSVGRKFLVAGHGGLNVTHSEPEPLFSSRYGDRQSQLEPYLKVFGSQEVQRWVNALGFETFVGSSGRVFPAGMKAAPLLRTWRLRLEGAGVRFHVQHVWCGWNEAGDLQFQVGEEVVTAQADVVVLALGGGSWPQLGSTGAWIPLLEERGVVVAPLRPANCGFNVAWSDYFRSRYAGYPLKSILLTLQDCDEIVFQQRGEFVLTAQGIEGSLIYAVSSRLRDTIEQQGKAEIHLDLAPDWTLERLVGRLSRPRGGRTLSSHLERSVGLKGAKMGLLRELLSKEILEEPEKLARAIKDLVITLQSPRPLAEAISSAGGVRFDALDPDLMLRVLPGYFCAGEMLDWEAPTGGYLLTACLATGRAAGAGALKWCLQQS